MYEFKLPDLGEGIHEGEVLKWHVAEGGHIDEDKPLIDVETDKAAVTIPSPKSGTIKSLSGNIGDIIHVGNVIAIIDDGSGTAVSEKPIPPVKVEKNETKDVKPAEPSTPVQTKIPAPQVPSTPEPTQIHVLQVPAAPAQTQIPAQPVPAAPATRRLARVFGVNINLIPPSGPGGKVTPEDVKRFAERPRGPVEKVVIPAVASPVPDDIVAHAEFAARAASTIPLLDIEPLPDFTQFGPVETNPLRSIRRKVAHKMVTSMILIPHVSHMDEADVTQLEAFRKQEKTKREGQHGGHLTLLSFVIKAVVAGLKASPVFNASLDPFKEEIIYKKYYNIGIAVDTPSGLIVPVIRDAHTKSIIQISGDIEDLVAHARDGKITVEEMRGGTFTITNIGPLGGTALLPTINYPEAAILAMGAVQDKAVVRDGQIVIRKMLPLTLAFDHRIADGADAARFVTELTKHLSDPSLLLLET